MTVSVLIVDDEINWIKTFSDILVDFDICHEENIYSAISLFSAYDFLGKNKVDIIFLDLNLNNESGQEAIKYLVSTYKDLIVVIMSGITIGPTPINCMKLGAYDYLPKAMSTNELVLSINKIVSKALKNNEVNDDSYDQDLLCPFSIYITQDKKMFEIFEYLKVISMTGNSILITGESGVGKGVLAKAIANYCRPEAPFVSLNVAGLDEQMFSDTLFGHTKGAYTNADSQRLGMIHKAKNGTLFLDEIGDLSLSQQIKLLYLTQTGEYQKIGSDIIENSSAKLIYATNQELIDLVNTGRFRKDLFYRLNTHHITIPPLRERTGDIPLLIRQFVSLAAKDYSISEPCISNGLINLLKSYSYPGNVRELRAIVYNAVLKCNDNVLTFSDFNFPDGADFSDNKSKSQPQSVAAEYKFKNLEELFDEKITDALRISDGNQTRAAALLGISQSTISRRMRHISKSKN